MNNLDKTVGLILPYIGDCDECDRIGDACLDCVREATDAAKDIAAAGLLTPDSVTYQEADYRHPGFYIVDETTERGPNLGDHVTRAKRLVGTWEEV